MSQATEPMTLWAFRAKRVALDTLPQSWVRKCADSCYVFPKSFFHDSETRTDA
jgi:hypothetical protein